MEHEYHAKVFKSGNSVALRLPKRLGLTNGDEMTIVPHADGSFSFWKSDRARAVFISLYGSMSPGFMADGRGEIEQDERDWTAPGEKSEAA